MYCSCQEESRSCVHILQSTSRDTLWRILSCTLRRVLHHASAFRVSSRTFARTSCSTRLRSRSGLVIAAQSYYSWSDLSIRNLLPCFPTYSYPYYSKHFPPRCAPHIPPHFYKRVPTYAPLHRAARPFARSPNYYLLERFNHDGATAPGLPTALPASLSATFPTLFPGAFPNTPLAVLSSALVV